MYISRERLRELEMETQLLRRRLEVHLEYLIRLDEDFKSLLRYLKLTIREHPKERRVEKLTPNTKKD